MALFTFILEYQGGTYISQVCDETVKKAIVVWARTKIKVSEIYDLSEDEKTSLIEEVEGDNPVAIETVSNVWSISLLTKSNKLAFVNIVLTEEADY